MGWLDAIYGFVYGVTPQQQSTIITTPVQQQPQAQPQVQSNPIQYIQTGINYVGTQVTSGVQNVASNPVVIAASTPITNMGNQIYTTVYGITPQAQSQIITAPVSIQPAQSPSQMQMNQQPQPITMASAPMGGMTFFVASGDVAQTSIRDAKAVVDPIGGGVGFYQVPQSQQELGFTRIYGFVTSSGSTGALQSGKFSTKPLTPVVYTQEGAMTTLDTSYADPSAAAAVLASPQDFSRVGAEVYGGYVQPLDGRTVQSTGATMGRYPVESGNLANLVDPFGPNQSKTNFSEVPWKINYADSPVIQTINTVGQMSPISVVGMQSIGMQPVITEVRTPSTLTTSPAPIGNAAMGWNPFVASAATPTGLISNGLDVGNTTKATPIPSNPIGQFFSTDIGKGMQDGLRMTLSPLFLPMAMAMDTSIAVARGDPTAIPFGDIIIPQKQTGITEEQYNSELFGYNANLTAYNTDLSNYNAGGKTDTGMFASLRTRFTGLQSEKAGLDAKQGTVVPTSTFLSEAGRIYEGFNSGLARYTTDISGLGMQVSKIPDVPEGTPLFLPTGQVVQNYGSAVNFAKGTYVGLTQHPVDLALTFAGGEVFGIGGNIAKAGVARAAMYEGKVPLIKAGGRVLSTPIAGDIIKVGMGVVGVAVVVDAGQNIIEQPTSAGKGEAFGRTALQFAGFGVGMANINPVTPVNDFQGRTFFSGERKFSPLESVAMDARAYVSSFDVAPELRSTYREIPKVFREGRYIDPQPGVTVTSPARPLSEPDISIASTIGERAPVIRKAIGQQDNHVILGSVVMEGQKSGLPTADLIRSSGNVHDLDLRVGDIPKFEADLASVGESTAGIDAKPFELGHPLAGDAGSPEGVKVIGFWTRLVGEPIPSRQGMKLPYNQEVAVGGKTYKGVLNEEMYNVQGARKAQAFMQDLVPAEKKVGNVDARALNEQFRLAKDYYDFQSIERDLIAGKLAAMRQGGKNVNWNDETPATRIMTGWDKTEINFDFIPQENNPIIGAQQGIRFQKRMTLGEIRTNMETSVRANRMGGNPLPSVLKPEPDVNIIHTPGLSRSVTSAISSPSLSSPMGIITRGVMPSPMTESPRRSLSQQLHSPEIVPSSVAAASAVTKRMFSPTVSPSPVSSMRSGISPVSPSAMGRSSPISSISSMMGSASPSSVIDSPSPGTSPFRSPSPGTSPFRSPSPGSPSPGSPSPGYPSPFRSPSPPGPGPTSPPSGPPSPSPGTPPSPPPSSPGTGPTTPPTPPPPTPPDTPFGGVLPGGGGPGMYGLRGTKTWTSTNPVGADLMKSTRGSMPNFKKMKGLKFKLPKF